MKQSNCKEVKLLKGEIVICDFGSIKLHSYKTNDPIGDTVFLLEKNGAMLIIEQPCFFDNIKELTEYIQSLGVSVKGKILSYHMAGGTFLPDTAVYATKNAGIYGHTGGGKGLIDKFAGIFCNTFDAAISKVTNTIKESNIDIAGITINVIENQEGFDIEVPEINSIYIHMLGFDTHSIIAGAQHADAIIAQLKSFIDKKYNFILTSHHMPETIKDAEIKISYLEELKKAAVTSKNAAEFKAAVKNKFASYSGENYLDMTAEFFFPNK